MYFISKKNVVKFVKQLMTYQEVVGPLAKGNRFVFDTLKNPAELRLDYDTTILPPKKFFLYPQQDLIKFSPEKIEGCLQPKNRILFGVHPYDLKAISMLDHLFREKNEDWNYLANREKTTIIGINVQNIYKHAFFESVQANKVSDGYDLFLTDIDDGFTVDIATDKGRNLLNFGAFYEATAGQIFKSKQISDRVPNQCPQKLSYSLDDISDKIRSSFNSPIWEELAEKCFSCGSCNMVCPSCYCFDVQDTWNIDQKSGLRFRVWDGCLTEDFAKISVQGGVEDFRYDRASRYRHRIMRKLVYLNAKLGGPACVGCGRCVSACTAGIANPVNVINKIMEA